MPKTQRWTQDHIRSARAVLAVRIEAILRASESQLRLEMKSSLGFTPDSSVTHESLRRWLVGVAIDQAFPDSPPVSGVSRMDPPPQDTSPHAQTL